MVPAAMSADEKMPKRCTPAYSYWAPPPAVTEGRNWPYDSRTCHLARSRSLVADRKAGLPSFAIWIASSSERLLPAWPDVLSWAEAVPIAAISTSVPATAALPTMILAPHLESVSLLTSDGLVGSDVPCLATDPHGLPPRQPSVIPE